MRKRAALAVAAEAYTLSYLVLFALLGTLARLTLQALASFPGAPVVFASVWPNFAGSFVFGLVADDRVLPRPVLSAAAAAAAAAAAEASASPSGENHGVSDDPESTSRQPTTTPAPRKKKTPLHVGLTTGFCGSFTSFSSFARDAFLALVDGLAPDPPGSNNAGTSGGRSFMALLAVLLATVSLSLAGLFSGAHAAQALKPAAAGRPAALGSVRTALDRAALVAAWPCWVAVVVLAAAAAPLSDAWLRGQVLFALAFAPLGCLARYYLSAALNGRLWPRFPLGTFAANVAGTAVLAAAWDLARARARPDGGGGGLAGCLVLQGVQDGFCGCLTTVSTWVAELAELGRRRTRDAYVYGASSVAVALVLTIAIMGGFAWSHPGDLEMHCVY
ncbi:hypothetical protein GGTG_01035 [Gaeumannomyces tritici R3-111a-1]|uniref:CrcB-like protein n=1 Tax=Gaeumannomyces tritici (strain R3-111a-1) TaxID=644352 RepID=J3NIF4_GAET3|nr:hypothetical protein GGTG_01035 [Gaeumannomyces tritici R3-111a-1]EJT81047.1 hypothetical protein GGTG_01035 [Gaeumannomyces tritici R3-111a-1]